MPRPPRKQSASGIYHVMLRGINRQVIFEDDTDRYCYIRQLQKCKEKSGFRLHAFCLMSNHVHLLIEPAAEPLDLIFKRIGSGYVKWYNERYDRVGHLFQDRFRSECVETEAYYRTVLRYILLNPLKGGLETRPGTYRWSSYLAYEKGQGTLTDTQYALDLFGSRKNLLDYIFEENDDIVLDEEQLDPRLREASEKKLMLRITGCASVSEFQQLDLPLRRKYVRELSRTRLSTGRISLLTGMPKSTVYKITRDVDVWSVGNDGDGSFRFLEPSPSFHEPEPALPPEDEGIIF